MYLIIGDPSERLLSRKIGAMIISHIGCVVPPAEFVKSYLQYFKKLAEDANWEIRQLIAEKIVFLSEYLGPDLTQAALFEMVLKIV